jgi:hypothetical protein
LENAKDERAHGQRADEQKNQLMPAAHEKTLRLKSKDANREQCIGQAGIAGVSPNKSKAGNRRPSAAQLPMEVAHDPAMLHLRTEQNDFSSLAVVGRS